MYAIAKLDFQTLNYTMLVPTFQHVDEATSALPQPRPGFRYMVVKLDDLNTNQDAAFEHNVVLTKGHGWSSTGEVHNFQKFDATQIFCTLCGTVRSLV